MKLRSPLWLLLAAAPAVACSAIVSPDLQRLDPANRDAQSATDSTSSPDAPGDTGADSHQPDSGPPDAPPPDSGVRCPASCEDGIPCTVDSCNATTGQCVHMPNDTQCPTGQTCNPTMGCMTQPCTSAAQCTDNDPCNGEETCTMGRCARGPALNCDDGQACNGVEQCVAGMGCRPGTAMVCTADACHQNARCDPRANSGHGACASDPLDADRDGAPAARVGAMMCAGGTDCDDSNPTIRPGAMEVCNSLDDNCNGMIDEGLSCGGTTATDSCAAAMTVMVGATPVVLTGTTEGATNDIDSNCGTRGGPDVWYRLDWPADQDLTVEASPTGTNSLDPVLVARDSCTATAFLCNDDGARNSTTSRLFFRRNQFGTGSRRQLYVAVDSYSAANAGTFQLRVVASGGAAGTCDGSRMELGAGGTLYAGALPTRTGAANGTCNMPMFPGMGVGLPEDLYSVTPTMRRQYNVQSFPGTMGGRAPVVYSRGTSCMGSELLCVADGSQQNFTADTAGAVLFVDQATMNSVRDYVIVIQPQ